MVDAPYIWALPVWGGGGGGLNTCPDGLGHLFREELSKFKWALGCFFGGDKSKEPKVIIVFIYAKIIVNI